MATTDFNLGAIAKVDRDSRTHKTKDGQWIVIIKTSDNDKKADIEVFDGEEDAKKVAAEVLGSGAGTGNRKPLPSKPPPKAYLNHTVQANQTCQGPPWILPVTPVSTGRVQATSKHLTASLRVECVPGTQPHKPVRPTAGRARRNPSTLGSDRAADARAIRRSRCAESQPNQPAEVADVRRLAPPASLHVGVACQ